jgi:hypothetical protein
MKLLPILLTVLFQIMPSNANAAKVCFSGTLGDIYDPSATSMYSGLTIGDSFSGCITIGDSSTDASNIVITPPGSDYSFTGSTYGGTVNVGSTITTGTESGVGIEDSGNIGDDTVNLNSLYGTVIPPATLYDGWDAYSSDATKGFGFTLYSLDTSIISGLDYQILPFSLDQADYAMFYLEDTGTADTYLATGFLTSVTVVPIPAAAWLFCSGLVGLIGIARRKKG